MLFGLLKKYEKTKGKRKNDEKMKQLNRVDVWIGDRVDWGPCGLETAWTFQLQLQLQLQQIQLRKLQTSLT